MCGRPAARMLAAVHHAPQPTPHGRDHDHRCRAEARTPVDLGRRRLRRRRRGDRRGAAGATCSPHVGIAPGQDVLDVATGTGNIAVRAAAAGARVTGLDLTPELFEIARARGRRARRRRSTGSRATRRTCPSTTRASTASLSAFGVQFAPRHEVVGGGARARLPPRRAHRARQLDARGPGRRDVRDHGPLHAGRRRRARRRRRCGATRTTCAGCSPSAGSSLDVPARHNPLRFDSPSTTSCSSRRTTARR